jgi:N-acetyl-beta-hexosaminidase
VPLSYISSACIDHYCTDITSFPSSPHYHTRRLHLHLTDSQSFPLLLDDVPITVNGKSGKLLALSRLGREGRYDDTKMYTLSQLATLVQYAQHKGVEIVPEIDFPAHVHVWGKAFPSLLVTCPEYSAKQQSPSDIHLLGKDAVDIHQYSPSLPSLLRP